MRDVETWSVLAIVGTPRDESGHYEARRLHIQGTLLGFSYVSVSHGAIPVLAFLCGVAFQMAATY